MNVLELRLETAINEAREFMDVRLSKEDAEKILALLKEQEMVVRCKDCKHWNAGTCLNDNVFRQIEVCGCYPDFVTDSNWFCAEGERR